MVAEASQTGRCRCRILLILMIFSSTVQAQFYETIRSGRPGQSIGASTVGKHIFQIQSGVDRFGFERRSQGIRGSGLLTNTGFRLGVTDYFEVGGFLEYRSEEVTINNAASLRFGISNASIGLRHQISVGDGLLPGVGFQFRLRLPVANEYYRIDNVAPSFVFVTSQQWKGFTLITNLGGAWNGTDATPSGNYTINLSYAFTDTFGAFVENYGTLTAGTFETRMDMGFAWLATKDLQLDLLGGFGNNNGLHDYFISSGFSWRTSR